MLSACSAATAPSASATASAPAPIPRPTAQLVVEVSLRGSVRGSGRLGQSAEVATCRAFAAGILPGRTFAVPSGLSTATIDGNPFALDASIAGYHGPGTYGAASFGDPTSTNLTVDLSSSTDPFEPGAAGASEAATVDADGSGSFRFTGWRDPALRVESGAVVWTCRDPG